MDVMAFADQEELKNHLAKTKIQATKIMSLLLKIFILYLFYNQ